ncbi:hypothetical protein NAEGRDRAFT_57718 [Naegleria gruberi]|uniref:Uncharacterized protein n=1 Tax=Naegleria gruberi TaxID=5762 RepID=D2VBP0_NAEGR|nr:uncharacterized protein NAEGRDRAFT_57718 [Naegleria gruberi]EFC45942.1 hypothetical protein NAEGRDRAFT_57718 [Naegleria gruberi]|eukprot:XP_002678686.1 hypothetical protein NAEGRDRAFT_57718 [Naegleria gruberi strain NEG-M]
MFNQAPILHELKRDDQSICHLPKQHVIMQVGKSRLETIKKMVQANSNQDSQSADSPIKEDSFERVEYSEEETETKPVESSSSNNVEEETNQSPSSTLLEENYQKLNSKVELCIARSEQIESLKDQVDQLEDQYPSFDELQHEKEKLERRVDEKMEKSEHAVMEHVSVAFDGLKQKIEQEQIQISTNVKDVENNLKKEIENIESSLSNKFTGKIQASEDVILQHVSKLEDQLQDKLVRQSKEFKDNQELIANEVKREISDKIENSALNLEKQILKISNDIETKALESQQALNNSSESLSTEIESVKTLVENSKEKFNNIDENLKAIAEIRKQLQESKDNFSKFTNRIMWFFCILVALIAIVLFRVIPSESTIRYVEKPVAPLIRKCQCSQSGTNSQQGNILADAKPQRDSKLDFVINAKISIFGQGHNHDNQEELLEFLGDIIPNVQFTSNMGEKYDMNIVMKNVGIRRLEEDISFVDWKEFERKLPVPQPTLFLFVHNVESIPANPLAFLLRDYIRKFPLSSYVAEISYDTGIKSFQTLEFDLKEHIKSIVSDLKKNKKVK